MYRWLFTLIGVASLCPLVLVAQQEVQVHVESLIGNEAVTAPVPVRVTLSNKGALTRGTLEWRVKDRTRCFIPIVLPRGGRKQVELAVSVDAWQHTTSKKRKRQFFIEPALIWREEGKPDQRLPVPFKMSLRLPLIVVGDGQGGFETWQRATYQLDYKFLGAPVDTAEGWSWTPVYMRPEQLPTNPLTLRGVPIIVLTEGCERLRPEQWDMLIYWSLCGGHLIISVGSLGLPLTQTPLRVLVPAQYKRVRLHLTQPITPFSLPPPRDPVVLVEAHTARGWRIYRSGKVVLASSTQLGLGKLTLFWGDLTATAWRRWTGYPLLISAWASTPEPPTLKLRQALPSPANGLPLSLRLMSVLGGVLVFHGVSLLLLWRILRRLKRLRAAPYALLGLAVLTGATLWLLLPVPEANEPYLDAPIEMAHPPLPHRVLLTNHRFSLSTGVHTLDLPPDSYWLILHNISTLDTQIAIHPLPPVRVHCRAQGKAVLNIVTIQFTRVGSP
jgi:hypothetical protein